MINIIAAMTKNRVIGRKGKLPWKMSSDLKRFKEITKGHPVITGRKTFESVGRVLPWRTNIIVSHQKGYKVEGAIVVNSLDEGIEAAKKLDDEIFIIGGGQIFEEAMTKTEKMYLTIIDTELDGDTYFPKINDLDWIVTSEESHKADEDNDYDYKYITYLAKFCC